MFHIGSSATDGPPVAEDGQVNAPVTMKRAKAFQIYSRLQKMATCVQDEDDFHHQYLGVARNVMQLFPFPQSSGVKAAAMPDPSEVCAAMSDMLPSPASVFTADYFTRPVFPLKVLFNIAELFGFDGIPNDLLAQVFIRDHESGHKSILIQAWFAFVLGLNPSSTCSVIDRFQQARSLPSRPVGNVNTIDTPPATVEPIMAPGSLTPVRPQRAHVPPGGPGEGAFVFDNRFNHGHERATDGTLGPNLASGYMSQFGAWRGMAMTVLRAVVKSSRSVLRTDYYPRPQHGLCRHAQSELRAPEVFGSYIQGRRESVRGLASS